MNFLVWKTPDSGEWSSYNRNPWYPPEQPQRGEIVLQWSSGTPIASMPATVTPDIDGVAQPPVPLVTGVYRVPFDLPPGKHFLTVTGLPSHMECLGKTFVVKGQSPLIDQGEVTYWNRFEHPHHSVLSGRKPVKIPFNPRPPRIARLKPREHIVPNRMLGKHELWTTQIVANVGLGQLREWRRLPSGNATIENTNLYFYAMVQNASVQPLRPGTALRDGPRGQGTIGHLYSCQMHPSGRSVYTMDVMGRLASIIFETGEVRTIAGIRSKPGQLPAHAAASSRDPAWYEAQFEVYGNWAAVRGKKFFSEPWGMVALEDTRYMSGPRYEQFIVCDTMHDRLIGVNHAPWHRDVEYLKPLPEYVPASYTPPEATTEMSDVYTVLDRDDVIAAGLDPVEVLNQPFGIAQHPLTKRIWWTNYGNGTVCSVNANGTDIQVEFRTARYYSDAELLIPTQLRLQQSSLNSAQCRARAIDGPEGMAVLLRPQAIQFMSNGRCLIGSRYDFSIRELHADRSLTTFKALPMQGATSFGQLDVNLFIDRVGGWGVPNAVYVRCWWQGDFVMAPDGGPVTSPYPPHGGPSVVNKPFDGDGNQLSNFVHTGPLHVSWPPGYAWGMAIGQHAKSAGMAFVNGSAGAFQGYLITPRLPTDPTPPDITRYRRGEYAYHVSRAGRTPMAWTHGPYGQGRLGYPYIDELGIMGDAELRAHCLAHDVDPLDVDDVMLCIRWWAKDTIGVLMDDEHPAPPPPPPPQPDDYTFTFNGRLWRCEPIEPSELNDRRLRIDGVDLSITEIATVPLVELKPVAPE